MSWPSPPNPPESPAPSPDVPGAPASGPQTMPYPPASAPPASTSYPPAPPAYPPAPPAYPPAPPAYIPPVVAPPGVNGFAVASLVLSFCGALLLSIAFGIIALVQTKRSGQRGRGLAIAGLAISSVWIVLLAGAVAVGLAQRAERDDTGQVTEAGDVGVFDLRVGDCIESLAEGRRLTDVPVVPCSEPHRGEVYAQFDLPGSSYPGQDEVFAIAEDECLTRLESYSQSAMADPTIEIIYMYPTSQSWRRGEQAITCIAVSDTPRVGSIQD